MEFDETWMEDAVRHVHFAQRRPVYYCNYATYKKKCDGCIHPCNESPYYYRMANKAPTKQISLEETMKQTKLL